MKIKSNQINSNYLDNLLHAQNYSSENWYKLNEFDCNAVITKRSQLKHNKFETKEIFAEYGQYKFLLVKFWYEFYRTFVLEEKILQNVHMCSDFFLKISRFIIFLFTYTKRKLKILQKFCNFKTSIWIEKLQVFWRKSVFGLHFMMKGKIIAFILIL